MSYHDAKVRECSEKSKQCSEKSKQLTYFNRHHMPESIKERTIEFVKYKGFSMKTFEQRCNLSTGYVTSMRKGFGPEKLNNVLMAFPELNRDWLLYGEGEMLKETIGNGTSSSAIVSDKSFRTYFKEENVRMVPLLNIDSVGGMHSSNEVGEYEPEFILDMLPFKGAIQGDVAIKETGDSMSPRIPSGAIMLLRRVMEWQEYFGYGHVFVLVLTDGRRITKRVTKCIENPREYVLCESINPAYPSEELPKKMIYSVWKVIDVLVHEGY